MPSKIGKRVPACRTCWNSFLFMRNNNNNNISINTASKLPVIGISILLILLGLFYLLLPEIAFEIRVFRFRWLLQTSSEPTDGVILFYRILGGITSIIGIIILIIIIIV